jgi:hypothetical protein
MSANPDDDAGFDAVQTINDYADYYGVPADLAQAVMQRESGGNHYGRDGNVLTSSRGYRGLMQMHPITGAGLGLGFNVNDSEENVHAGLKYLGQNLQELAALPDLQAKYFAARRIAAVRPLTEEEKRILEVDKMDGSMLGGLPVAMAPLSSRYLTTIRVSSQRRRFMRWRILGAFRWSTTRSSTYGKLEGSGISSIDQMPLRPDSK